MAAPASSAEAEGVAVPEAFLCPITLSLMTDPATTADGHSYERAAIANWLQQRAAAPTSPLTGMLLPSLGLTPNHALRHAIEKWLAETRGSPLSSRRTRSAAPRPGTPDLSTPQDATPRDATIIHVPPPSQQPALIASQRNWVRLLADAAQRGSVALVAAVADAAECPTPRPEEGIMVGNPAAGAMAMLASTTVARRRSLLSHGAADVLLQQLASHGTHACVVEASCRAFVALMAPSPEGTPVAVFAPELLDEIARALTGSISRHAAHPGACAAAASALANVTATEDDAGRVAAFEAGAVATCSAALTRHAAAIQAHDTLATTCGGALAGALSNICAAGAMHSGLTLTALAEEELVGTGTVPLLLRCLRAIENAPQSPQRVQAEVGFLRLGRSLTRSNAAARLAVAMHDGFPLLVRCARSTGGDADLIALQVLANTLCGASNDVAQAALNASVLETAAACGKAAAAAERQRQAPGAERKLACAAILARLVGACASDHAAGGGHTLRLRASRCDAAHTLRDTMCALPHDMRAQATAALAIIG